MTRRRHLRGLGALALAAAVAAIPVTSAAQETGAEPLPEPGTELRSGRYVSSVVGPRVDLRVGEGWIVGPSGDGPIFTLELRDEPGTVLSVTRFDGDVFLDSCDPSSMTTVEASVPRLLEVIAGNPYLNASAPRQVEVDGYQGVSLDVATPAYQECGLPWLLIWALPIGEGGEFVQVADQQSRFIILDVEGDVVVVAIESFPGVPFGGLLETSLDVVESMRIEPGAYEPPAGPAATAAPPTADASPSPAATGN
jgi:hypothetical protein